MWSGNVIGRRETRHTLDFNGVRDDGAHTALKTDGHSHDCDMNRLDVRVGGCSLYVGENGLLDIGEHGWLVEKKR